MTNQLTFYTASAGGWERALYAFLAGKERRSGSRRTVEGYSRMRVRLRRTSAAAQAWAANLTYRTPGGHR